MRILKYTLLSLLVICLGCDRESVLSFPRDAPGLNTVRIFFSTPQVAQVSELILKNESLVCIIHPSGAVVGRTPSPSVRSTLLNFKAPWIADDSYWTLVIFDSKKELPVRAFAIERSRVSDIESNLDRACIEPKEFVNIRSTPNESYPRLTTY